MEVTMKRIISGVMLSCALSTSSAQVLVRPPGADAYVDPATGQVYPAVGPGLAFNPVTGEVIAGAVTLPARRNRVRDTGQGETTAETSNGAARNSTEAAPSKCERLYNQIARFRAEAQNTFVAEGRAAARKADAYEVAYEIHCRGK
jgi:hypothetical protein